VAAHHRSWHTSQVFHGTPRPSADLPRSRSREGARSRPQVSPRTPTG
jgi:putative restriction endonuclease